MDIYRLKDLSNEERQTVFLGEAVKQEEQVYFKPLTPEELAIKREEMSNATILLDEMESELKTIKAAHKEKAQPIQEARRFALDAIRHRGISSKGRVWFLPDYDNSMMHFITDEGFVLGSRTMLPEERQYRITTLNKAV